MKRDYDEEDDELFDDRHLAEYEGEESGFLQAKDSLDTLEKKTKVEEIILEAKEELSSPTKEEQKGPDPGEQQPACVGTTDMIIEEDKVMDQGNNHENKPEDVVALPVEGDPVSLEEKTDVKEAQPEETKEKEGTHAKE